MNGNQFSKDRSNSIISSTSLRPSYYDPITGNARESGVNISIGGDDNPIIMTVPINNKTSDAAAAFTLTSIKSDWIEDYYNINRSSLATDMVRVDISDHLESVGDGCSSSSGSNDNNNFIFRLPLKTGNSLNAPRTPSIRYSIFCRRNEPLIKTYNCYGKIITLKCDGVNRYNTSITCEYKHKPTCVLPSELSFLFSSNSTISSGSGSSGDVCKTIDYNNDYVVCSCNLCLTSIYNYNIMNTRRSLLSDSSSGSSSSCSGSGRLLQGSSLAGESEHMEVVAMVEYVILDTGK